MSKLTDRVKDFVMDSPVVGVPVAIAVLGYGAVRGLAEGVKWQFDSATKHLTHFEPNPPQDGPDLSDKMAIRAYQEDLEWSQSVMGNGRAEKLVARLEITDIPQADKKSQIWALSQSYAGITNLPSQEQLVKYGLNDRAVLSVARGIDLASSRVLRELSQEMPREEWKQSPKAFIQGRFDGTGLKVVSTNEVLRDRAFFLAACVKSSLESCSFHDRKDPATKDKLAEVVLDWLVKDVQPEVPGIFGDLKEPEFVPQRRPGVSLPRTLLG